MYLQMAIMAQRSNVKNVVRPVIGQAMGMAYHAWSEKELAYHNLPPPTSKKREYLFSVVACAYHKVVQYSCFISRIQTEFSSSR